MHDTNFKHQILTRRASKRRRLADRRENTTDVRAEVVQRDGDCRLTRLLLELGVALTFRWPADRTPEWAHKDGRGMGGNPDLSRDTTDNTLILARLFHQGRPMSLHTGHLKVRALSDKGMDGPVCFELYEALESD